MKQLPLFEDEVEHGTNTVHVRCLTAAKRAKLARAARPEFRRGRGESAALILDVLWSADAPMRRAEIFHAMQREVTPFLTALLEDMVAGGDVLKTVAPWPGPLPVYLYEANRAKSRPEWSVR